MKLRRLFAFLLTALALPTLAHGQEAGSVLIFPVIKGDSHFTLVSVTNTNPMRPVRLMYRYVNVDLNPLDPLHPTKCSLACTAEYLTPNDTTSGITKCSNPDGDAGFLMVIAQDPFNGCNVSHNWLVGSQLVMGPGGTRYSMLPYSFKAVPAAFQCTELNFNGFADFNGVEYEAGPDNLALDFFAPTMNSSLVLFPLLGDPRNSEIAIRLDVFNDNEFPLSFTFSFKCWMEIRLSDLSGLFTETFLNNLPSDPRELDLNCDSLADVETGWIRVDAISASGPFSSLPNPVVLGAVSGGPQSIEGGRTLWRQGVNLNGQR